MGLAVMLPIFLPWLDRCKVKSIRYRGWTFKVALAIFATSFLFLGYLGLVPVSDTYTLLARVFTATYFGFFVLMPFYTSRENTKPVPERVTK
jgi:ubiquinol-cytochrome c reductase cytochrome b subunit